MFVIKTEHKYKSAVLIFVCILAVFATTFSSMYLKSREASASVSFSAKNNAERLAFLSMYNVKVQDEAFSVSDVIIPANFDGVYQSFENVQNAQGLSLSEYKGQKVRRYSYLVTNPPKGFGETTAELFVLDGEIIACALCDMQNKNGFCKIIG